MPLLHNLENGIEEASVLVQGWPIVRRKGRLDGAGRSRRYDFKPAYKNANDLFRLRVNGKGKDAIDVTARHKVDQAAAFFEPRVPPSCHHGARFVRIKTPSNEVTFQFLAERIHSKVEIRRVEDGFTRERTFGTIADVLTPALEEKQCWNILFPEIRDD